MATVRGLSSSFPIWGTIDDEEQLQAQRRGYEKCEGDVYLPSADIAEHEYEVLDGPSFLGLQKSLFDLETMTGLTKEVTFRITLPYRSGLHTVTVKATIRIVERKSEYGYWNIGGSIIIPFRPTERPSVGFLGFEGEYSTRTRRGIIFF